MFLDRNCGCGYTPMFNNQMPTPEYDQKEDMQEMPGLDNMDPNMYQNACGCDPICERPQERIIHRCMVHEVKHICPIRTRIINHHIFKHTYCPAYTCCEQNECSNINQGSCCNF